MTLYIRETAGGQDQWSDYEQLGFAVSCMLHHRNYSLHPIKSVQERLIFAIQHGQIKFLFDTNDQPLAYVLWACLTKDTETQLQRDPGFPLHPSEWNEGDRIWLLDFCCRPGFAPQAIKRFNKLKPWGEGQVRWQNRKRKVMTLA